MRRFRPVHGVAVVAIVMAIFLLANHALQGGFDSQGFERVAPGPDETVRIDVSDLEAGEAKFYRFLNAGNQEVKFFVGRDRTGEIHAAFDANEICFKRKRGYSFDNGWFTCRVCDKSFALADVNEGQGGCEPVPVKHRVEGDELIIAETAMLEGWRYFR